MSGVWLLANFNLMWFHLSDFAFVTFVASEKLTSGKKSKVVLLEAGGWWSSTKLQFDGREKLWCCIAQYLIQPNKKLLYFSKIAMSEDFECLHCKGMMDIWCDESNYLFITVLLIKHEMKKNQECVKAICRPDVGVMALREDVISQTCEAAEGSWVHEYADCGLFTFQAQRGKRPSGRLALKGKQGLAQPTFSHYCPILF